VAFTPFAAGIVLAAILGPLEFKALSVVLGTALMFVIHLIFVPLEPR
jgi:hypothetical protein